VPGRSDAGADGGSIPRSDAGAPNVGQPCRSGQDSCRAPSGGRCLDQVDPAAALIGLLEPLLDFFDEDAGSARDEDAGVRPAPIPADLVVETPGGYCSAPCTGDDECGAGGACLSALSLWRSFAPDQAMQGGGFVAEPGVCLEPCDRTSDCRQAEGYVCRSPLQNLISINGWPLPLDRPLFCLPPAPAL
jgi:hypothetical protein